jgi:hypothetical protein
MARPRRNLFYPMLGVVGFLFTITAASYCVSVLRGVRPETADREPHALQRLMDRHGTTLLVIEIALLAVGTFGAIAVDELGHREVRPQLEQERQRRLEEQRRNHGAGGQPDGAPEADAGDRS